MSSLADLTELTGFFSYARQDDEGDDGTLSTFRRAIHRELIEQLGRSRRDFRIWQDDAAIQAGTLWKEEIENAIDQSVFFIPIITPRAIRNPYCAFELKAFLAREAGFGRSDLIFPILYVPVPELDDGELPQNSVHRVLHDRQYLDWREMRYRDLNEPEVRKKLSQFCRNISDALRKPWESPEERLPRQIEETRRRAAEAEAARQAHEEQLRREAEGAARMAVEERRRAEVESQRRTEAEARSRADREHQHQRIESRRDSVVAAAPPLPARSTRPVRTKIKLPQSNTVEPQSTRDMLQLRYLEGSPSPSKKAKARNGTTSNQEVATDEVDCSVFAPTVIRSGSEALIQVFLHVPTDAIAALGIAIAADPSIDRQITHSLSASIERGKSVQIFFDPGGLRVPNGVPTDQLIVWKGRPTSCAFRVFAPGGLFSRNYHPTIRVAVDGRLVGCITFCVRRSFFERTTKPLLAGAAKAYRSAFVSYASKDRNEVLRRTQALRAAIQVRQDILDLDPGARWEAELYKWIDEADLFLLCWSHAARNSTWVMKEARYALKRQRRSHVQMPDIVPLVLEPPPHAKPPKWLSHLHFNDSICSIIGTERADHT